MSPIVWIVFIAFILLMLAIDLGVFNREARVIHFKEAMGWLCVWVGLAAVFNVFLYYAYAGQWWGIGTGEGSALTAKDAAMEFLTGYLVELSLSVDNIFVIAIIFQFFRVPAEFQHRVLFWGIIGAIVLRGVMILIGTELIMRYNWVIYILGGFLILTAFKMLFMNVEEMHPEKNPVLKLARRILPVSDRFDGHHFTTRVAGKWMVTPLFLCLILIETTDLVFAFDSIPAIFGITRDPFIVFTSNMFAILGLRTMYFGLSGLLSKFRFLSKALVFVLLFVGVKMCIHHWVKIDNTVSLAVVAGILGIGVTLSLVVPEKEAEKKERAA
ncbi:MAG: TerC family protein [Phycisphaerales bacterium]